jgi:hypothetical protein
VTTVSAVHDSYRVHRGDTLSSIARRVLGSARRWPVLWWDNQGQIPNPADVSTGMTIRYGHWNYVRPWLRRRAMAAIPAPVPAARSGGTDASAVAPAPQAPAPAPAPAQNVTAGGSFEQCVISRESGGNPAAFNPSSGAGGLFQFLPSTWASLGLGYPGGAQTAPVSVQMEGFSILYAEAGTSPWASYDGC